MEKRGNWSSTFGFLMAAIGSAVGLGNMWGFPYKMGSNGGFAFLIIYLVLALLCGIVIMTIEMTIGRKTGKSPVLAMGQIGKRFKFVGWFGVLSAFIIMGFYTMIMGWVVRYVVDFFQAMIGIDVFAGMNGVEYFSSVYTDTTASFIYTFIAFALTSVIVMGGVSKGIERFSKIAIPALFGLLIVVIIKGLTMPGAGEGVKFMFTFDAENFNLFKTVRSAGGQMMFSLSLGMGILITYGSYMNKSENILEQSAFPYGSIAISAMENLGIDGLKRAILQKFREEFIFCTLFVPYAQMNEYQAIKDCLTERRLEYTDDGAKIDAVIPARYSEKFTRFLADND